MGQTRSNNLTRGATVMVASVALAKLLGVIYVVPLTGLIKKEGLGIYQNAYALYVILLTLATSGFPTAMGKLIAERLALRRQADVEQLYRVTMRTVILLAVVCFLITWFGAPLYSYLVAIKDPGKAGQALIWSIRALAPSVLVVPVMSALRGYLQGHQLMEPSGYSQAIEQLFRIIAMLVGAAIVMKLTGSIAAGAAAATFGAFVGAVAGLVLLIVAVVRLRRQTPTRQGQTKPTSSDQQMRKALLQVALPVCFGALVVPISNFVDSVTVQNILMFTGESFHQATGEFGVLSRQAFTLIQLPLAFAMAIGATVLPAISQAQAVRDQAAIQRNVSGTIRSMFFITFPAAASFFILARPIDLLLFNEYEGAAIISSISFMGIFSSLELISTYMLQGLGKMYRPVRNMFIGVFIKLVFNVLLIFHLHIMGAAIATTIGYLVSSFLNIMAVKKYGKVRISILRLAVPSLLAALVLCAALGLCDMATFHVAKPFLGSTPRLLAAAQTLVPILIGAVVYVIVSIRLKAVSADELQRIPGIGRRLSGLATRIQPNQPGRTRLSRY